MFKELLRSLTTTYSFVVHSRDTVTDRDRATLAQAARIMTDNADEVWGGSRPDHTLTKTETQDLCEAVEVCRHIEEMQVYLLHQEII